MGNEIDLLNSDFSAESADMVPAQGNALGFGIISVRPARAKESSALAGRTMYSDTSPGALPRAGMLRAVGATSASNRM